MQSEHTTSGCVTEIRLPGRLRNRPNRFQYTNGGYSSLRGFGRQALHSGLLAVIKNPKTILIPRPPRTSTRKVHGFADQLVFNVA